MADAPEYLREGPEHLRIVVHQQHTRGPARPRQRRLRLGPDGLARDREGQREGRPARRLALDADVAAVPPHDRIDHRQAESRSAFALRREERLEDPPAHRLRHTDAGVGHRQGDVPSRVAAGRDRQSAAVGHRVERVENQIRHQLGQRGRPAVDGLDGAEIEPEIERPVVARDLLFPARADDRDGVVDDLVHVDADELLVGPQARELLDAAYRLGAVHRGRLHDVQRPAHEVDVPRILLHELGVPEDRLEEVVEVVRDAAGQLPEGGQLLGLA